MASPPQSHPTFPTPHSQPLRGPANFVTAFKGPSRPFWLHSLLAMRKDQTPALLHSELLMSRCSAPCRRSDRLTWAFPAPGSSQTLGVPASHVQLLIPFLLMKDAITQIIWKGKSGIYYLGVPLPCCSYKFKLRFLRIRLNMTKIAVWAV